MFSDHSSWVDARHADIYRWLSAVLAATYVAVWTAIAALVQDPWQTYWIVVGIFVPLALGLVCVPLGLALNASERRNARE